jgi:hypothetical protein
MKSAKTKRAKKSERNRFIEAARELGAEMTEVEFKEAMGKIAKGKSRAAVPAKGPK